MSLKRLADDAINEIQQSLNCPLSDDDLSTLRKIIEHNLAEAAHHTTKCCTDAVVVCCGPEADLAHKMAEEADRAREALVANLMSMR